jgi:diguanylate cyclase (GGDEF)-like protein
MWEAIHRDGQWAGEVWDKRKNGEVYPKWLTITAVKNRGEVSHYVAVFVDITERKQADEEIYNLAFFDPLTHLPNRRLLLDRMRSALAQSARSKHYGALMFLDLDHFKVLNDTKGHAYGDKMLVEVARRLNACIREVDSVARFGGDEFVVLLEGLSEKQDVAATQAGIIAEKIRATLSQTYFLDGHAHESSPSVGVILFNGEEVDIDELFKRADLAMYQAKEGGRNMVRFFEPAMQALLESRTLMEQALRQALPNGELELYFQVQTNQANVLLGAEVLLRWRSPILGMVAPDQFIPLAEKSKLILPIGRWVLENACARLKTWETHPVLSSLHLAVNVSPVQFHRPDFVWQVKEVLALSGANPNKLELELTENLVLEDIEEAITKMTDLKALGVRFSMDDFGTGYSSLQYIKRLPIDQLKIDQSFVRDILTDPGDAMMVQTIVTMARNFGYDVIAEGVEEHAQLSPLIKLGCETFQGYLFSRPVALADFERLIGGWLEH